MLRSQRILAVVFLTTSAVICGSAQEPDWSGLNVSVLTQWVFPQKEFGTYWNDGPAVGVLAGVPLKDGFSPVAMGVFSWHSPAETPLKSSVPQVLLFQLGGGMSWTGDLSPAFSVSLGAMLVNNAFILTGPAVRPGLENAMESEFGFSGSAALVVCAESLPPFSFMISYQSILVGLDPVAIASAGLAVRIIGR